ncbi:DNA polymerase III subunit delta [Candidatus Peregrinibacteria bacterium]|nr:DNA polymerase III subunit delta [Candidatus Peregrinibacteria bacterium]
MQTDIYDIPPSPFSYIFYNIEQTLKFDYNKLPVTKRIKNAHIMAAAKSGKKNVYLFFGEDTYSANHKLKIWQKAFEEKHGGDINIAVLEGRDTTRIELESAVNSAPFLAEKRLIIVKNFLAKGDKDEQKKVADLLEEELPDFSIIVFIEEEMPDKRTALLKKINKIGVLEEFESLIGPRLTGWIINKATEKNIPITPKVADYLGKVAGSELWNLNNELDKLKSYAKTQKIDEKAVDELVHPNLTTSIFKFTDYIAHKNRKGSLNTLDILIESGEEIVKIIFMIVRHFRILIQVKDLKDRGEPKSEIISKLKEHPFVVSTMLEQSPNFTKEQLKTIYDTLLKIDIGIKTGKIRLLADDKKEVLLALQKFVHTVCSQDS